MDLKEHMTLLDDSMKQLEDLNPQCIDTGMSYDERVANSKQPIVHGAVNPFSYKSPIWAAKRIRSAPGRCPSSAIPERAGNDTTLMDVRFLSIFGRPW